MSFRVSALVAFAVVLELGLVSPVSAQPIAPIRPRTSPFGSIFTPGLQQQQFQQQFMLNQALGGGVGGGFVNPAFGGFPGFGGFGGAGGIGGFPGFGYPGQLAYQSAFPGAYGAVLPSSGVAATFRNYGHWYNPRGIGYTGHWYPNGLANGRGVLGFGGSGGYGFGGGFAGPVGGGTNRMGASTIGNVGGTALGIGAMMNQFRR